jgi:hypothetical protein
MTVTRRCKKGMIYRKTYTRKGRRIAGRCIRSQTRAGETTRNKIARIRGRMTARMRGVRMTKRTLKSCPAGYVRRAAYMRYTKKGKHVLVPDACIKDVGAPGKGLPTGKPGIGPLRQGDLSRYGYTGVAGLSEADRRAALRQAVAAYGSLTVWRKLNALHIYTRRTSPATSRTVKTDMDWVRATYGIKAF